MSVESVKLFIVKLKTTSQYKLLINNFIVIAISLILLLLGIMHFYLILLYCIYIYYLYKKQKNRFLFKTVITIDLIVLLIYLIKYLLLKDYSLEEVEGILIDLKKSETYNKLIIKKGIFKYLVYDYDVDQQILYKMGDKITVKGINISIDKSYMKMMFDNQKYLFSKGIVSIIQKQEIDVQTKTNLYKIKHHLMEYINTNFDNNEKSFIYALVLGDSSIFNEEIKNNIRINGISHLFAISGLHISVITKALEKILPIKQKNIVINIFLAFYSFITSFSPSIIRSILMYYMKQISDIYNLKLSSIDIISIAFIIMIFINPYYVNNTGFILSFLVSFTFIITSKYLVNYNIIVQSLILSTFSIIATLPIAVNMNNSINIMQVFANVLFILLVSYVILPSTFISFFFPFLIDIYKIILNVFISLNSLFSNYLKITFILPNFNIIETLVYYLIIYLFIKNRVMYNKKLIKKYTFIILSLFCIYYNKSNLNVSGEVEFLDVIDGESILINLPLNRGVILIDTGTGKNDAITTYLQKKGIREIDYFILTHNHHDHNGEAQKILNEIKVHNLVLSAYDNSVFTVSNKTKVIRVKKGEILKQGKVQMEILSPYTKSSSDINDDSIIMSANIGNYKYLFLGDASNNILDSINCDADIVKGAHHGSKTSASNLFYARCTPTFVILQTGRTAKYGFPHKETVSLLESLNIKYYQTNICSSITIYYLFNKSIIKTHW